MITIQYPESVVAAAYTPVQVHAFYERCTWTTSYPPRLCMEHAKDLLTIFGD